MAIQLENNIESYVNGLKQLESSSFKENPKWLNEIKNDSINSFAKIGFPTLSDEDWRFTNLAPITRGSFQVSENGAANLSDSVVEKFSFKSMDSYKLVFVNGKYSKDLSDIGQTEDGIQVKSLGDAINEGNEVVEKHLSKYANYENDAFISLNTSYFEDGVFVSVARSAIIEKPIYVLYISNEDGENTFVNPRNLIIAEDNSQVKVVEHYVSTNESVYFSNVVTEIVVGENSNVEHYMLELESKKAFNISTLRVQQARSSNITSHSILVGGAIVRNNVHPVLNGEGCNSNINGLFMSNDRQHMDNFMRVEHAKPHCDSRQFYNGILDDRSRGVFHGRIIVHEGAMLTDAKQTNRNLLLSDTAQIDTKPQLEIYNDDVKCTHGATIGQMDDEAIFYLRSRGVPEKEAKAMMLRAFTYETLESMTIEPIKESLEHLIVEWFENSFD